MREYVKKFLVVILVLLLCNTNALAYNPIPSGVTGGGLYNGYTYQQKSNWCWAASSENMKKVENSSSTRTQWDAVAFIHDSSYPNNTATNYETLSAVKYLCYYNNYFSLSTQLSFSYISLSIYNNHPVIVRVANPSSVGHMMLMMGWGISDSNIEIVYFYDPGNGGSYQLCSYTAFYNGTSGYAPYTHSIYVPMV